MNYGEILYWSIEAVIAGSGLLVLVGIAAASEVWLRHRRDRRETNRQIAQHRAELKQKISEARQTEYLPPVPADVSWLQPPQAPSPPPDTVTWGTQPNPAPEAPQTPGEDTLDRWNRINGGQWQ